MMHKLVIGIEHVMTGVQLTSATPLTFERESPSMIRVLSESPIKSYWPAKQCFVESTTEERETETFSHGEAEYYAQVVGQALRATDGWAAEQVEVKTEQRPTEAVVKAMRRKFGKMADKYTAELRWNALNKCYFFIHAGVYHGVEEDGYINT